MVATDSVVFFGSVVLHENDSGQLESPHILQRSVQTTRQILFAHIWIRSDYFMSVWTGQVTRNPIYRSRSPLVTILRRRESPHVWVASFLNMMDMSTDVSQWTTSEVLKLISMWRDNSCISCCLCCSLWWNVHTEIWYWPHVNRPTKKSDLSSKSELSGRRWL